MKTFNLAPLLIGMLTFARGDTPENAAATLFDSVTYRNGGIVATLPASSHWLIQKNADSKPSRPGESFTLRDGDSLRLIEHHLSYKVTAQLSPKPGLKVEFTMDGRSFGGETARINSFLPAR